jgi:hypothetical protein
MLVVSEQQHAENALQGVAEERRLKVEFHTERLDEDANAVVLYRLEKRTLKSRHPPLPIRGFGVDPHDSAAAVFEPASEIHVSELSFRALGAQNQDR